jgi:hypothetical protein
VEFSVQRLDVAHCPARGHRVCAGHVAIDNLGLITQNTQWLLLMGVSFVVSAYLQVVRHYDAIQTGVIFTAPE